MTLYLGGRTATRPAFAVIVSVPNTASLVAPLLRQLPEALVDIAPERADELNAASDGLSLAIVDEPKFVCHYAPKAKRITISTGAVEVLRAASHKYLMHAGGVATDADELALSSVAFLLHHELAHHRLGHPLTTDLTWKLDQERDADYAAADWILQGVPEDDPRFRKRALGIATALAVSAAYGVHTRRHDGMTHPRSFDRLFHTLSRHIRDDGDEVWGFVVGILELHMTEAGFTLPSVLHASFKSCVDSYVEILAAKAAS